MIKGTPITKRDNRWHKKHLVKIVERKRVRIEHMKKSQIKPIEKRAIIKPEIKKSFWKRLWDYIKKILWHYPEQK